MSTAAAEKMPLSAHLREARTRTVRAAVALLIGTVIGYLTSDFVMDVSGLHIEPAEATIEDVFIQWMKR